MTDSFYMNMGIKDRYRLEERIGIGGMARVYKARDINLDRPVAIKIMHDYLASDTTFEQRFIREAKFVASFNHPNIVQIYDFDVIESDGSSIYYMVMPLLTGSTLKDILEQHAAKGERLPTARVVEIFKDVCGALSYAHSHGMVHRDVKPANIIFDDHDRAVLTDFGIARLAEGSSLTQEGVTTGTPAYMSPEQVTSAPVDARSDIYSLGIILFEMLAGTVPFNDNSGVSTMLKHVQEPVPRLSTFVPTINPSLESLLYRALAKRPEDRFSSVSEMVDALELVLTDDIDSPRLQNLLFTPSSAPISSGTLILDTKDKPRIETRFRPHSPMLILALGFGIIALLAVVALLTRPSPGPDTEGVPSMTGDSGTYTEFKFEPGDSANAFWTTGQTGSVTREITDDGFYRFRNERTGIATTSILEGAVYQDSVITMTGLLEPESAAASAVGIVFRYVDAENYYVFAVDGSQRYSIWVREEGQWSELRATDESWTFDDSIAPIGNMNELRIQIEGDHLIGSVNDVVVADVVDNTLAEGQVGLYLATPGSGMASSLIDSYLIEIGSIEAPSMTADQ